MRILLDTNILIPLEDSSKILGESYANFSRLASANSHKLLVHPASIDDINRDKDDARRTSTLSRLEKYPRLEQCTPCPWNTATTSDNDRADNEILFAVFSDAVHALVTQDAEIHKKAKERGLRERVHYIQAAEDLLHRLHALAPVALPSISDVAMHTLTAELPGTFFDSLRQGYDSVRFNKWFADKARDGRCAWVYRNEDQSLGAICIYALQDNEKVCDNGSVLAGRSLKLCTFKVGDSCRGRKIGELFLKAAFRYATSNAAEHVFIEVQSKEHAHLLALLDDFGFRQHGLKNADAVFVKKHPIHAPAVESHAPFEYHKAFFPHFVADAPIKTYIVPIQPEFHNILFPDFVTKQAKLFMPNNPAGNAIKLAYLCHAPTKHMTPGDVLLFYRSHDEKCITSVGVVESYSSFQDPDQIAQTVSRRTVYSYSQIVELAQKPTKVMLFRLAFHLKNSVDFDWLKLSGIVQGNIQSITQINEEKSRRVIEYGRA